MAKKKIKRKKQATTSNYTNDQFPVHPNGFGIAVGSNDVIVTFFWTPPENRNEDRVIARLALNQKQLEDLSKIFSDEAKILSKKKK